MPITASPTVTWSRTASSTPAMAPAIRSRPHSRLSASGSTIAPDSPPTTSVHHGRSPIHGTSTAPIHERSNRSLVEE